MRSQNDERSHNLPEETSRYLQHDIKQCIRSMCNLKFLIDNQEISFSDVSTELGVMANSLQGVYNMIFPD